jgi:hypothetical protein
VRWSDDWTSRRAKAPTEEISTRCRAIQPVMVTNSSASSNQVRASVSTSHPQFDTNRNQL